MQTVYLKNTKAIGVAMDVVYFGVFVFTEAQLKCLYAT